MEEVSAMSAFLTEVGGSVTQFITWVGDVGTAVVSTPILLVSEGVFLLGASVAIFKRMLKG